MKKYIAVMSLVFVMGMCSCSWGDVLIDANNFPDKNFREYVSSECDTNGDGTLSTSEISAVIGISVRYKGIASLTGIEYFTALETLTCNEYLLTALDVSHNTALTKLDCSNNQLTALDVSNNIVLKILFCASNQLTTLDVSNNTALERLFCISNQLTALDVSNNTALKYLSCASNQLTVLDVSNNPALTELTCEKNQLTVLDVSNSTALEQLICYNNQLIALDVSNSTALDWLWCHNNQLTVLDVSNNTALTYLHCEENQLTVLDVSDNTALIALYCYSNDISELDISNHDKLRFLNCGNNRIRELDLRNKPDLQAVACARNQIDKLDVTGSPKLKDLYCYNNRLRELDLSNNPDLLILSCTNNLLGEIDISHNPELREFDCGGNYLAHLDISNNPDLRALYFSGTTLRSIDLSLNTRLVSLDCISTDITTLDVSANSSLEALGCYGNSRLEALYIVSTDNPAYPYKTDLREYTGNTFSRITALRAFGPNDKPITVSFSQGHPEAFFAQLPNYIVYDYSNGYTGAAPASSVPRTMSVRMSVPTLNFIYLPKIEAKVVSVDSKVVSIDEAVNFSASGPITIERPDDNHKPDVQPKPDIQPENDTPDSPEAHGSSGGGCDSGFGLCSLIALGLLPLRKKHSALLAAFIVCSLTSCSAANVTTSDYTLPIPYDTYTISGTCTSDFTLTPELANTIAGIAGITADRVRPFPAASAWNVLPIDLYNISRSGEYGGVVLPLIANTSSSDRYVALCTFSSDVQPGEQISVHGFEIDPQTRESVYDENKTYLASFIVLDENLNRVEYVPASRKVYVAVSFRPKYVNSGIVTTVRGRYVEEEDPLYRMDPGAAQRIADDLGIRIDELKYLTRANIGKPVPPTEAMKKFVADDSHEIVINLPTISVDEQGRYMIPITLSDDEFALIKDKPISDYKTYALHDSDLGNGQMRPAFINGLLGTWEIYSLTGEKLEKFGVKEFLLVGILDAGNPFSLYLGRLLLMLLMGGCNSELFAGGAAILTLLFFIRR